MYSHFLCQPVGASNTCDGRETVVGPATGSTGSITKGVVAPGLASVPATVVGSTEAEIIIRLDLLYVLLK